MSVRTQHASDEDGAANDAREGRLEGHRVFFLGLPAVVQPSRSTHGAETWLLGFGSVTWMCAEQFVVARLAEFGEVWEHFHEHKGLVENLVLKHRGEFEFESRRTRRMLRDFGEL